MEKQCSRCKETKDINDFYKDKNKKSGYHSCCKLCDKIYSSNNKEKIKEYKKKYDTENKDKKTIHSREWKRKNKDRINKERKERRKTNIHIKFAHCFQSRIRFAMKASGNTKSASTMELIGCTAEFFKKYIESKFTKGMTYENHGNGGWHIDHILPIASFDLSDPEQQKICFHYTNMQPLWATTEIVMQHGENSNYIGNLEKQNKIDKGNKNDN